MKNKKLLTIAAIMASAMLFLSGCVQHTASGKPYGFVYDNLAVPTQHVLVWLSQILGNSLGWAIIVITFIVRLVLMPIMIKQSKNATVQQEKIAHIKPLMEDITKRQKEATSDAERMAINQEMMQLYRDNNISMTGGIGCLPLLIQMPIFAALYAAIQYSPELSRSYFYGINLGQRSFTLVALSFVVYALQGWLSTLGVPEAQRAQMRQMMIISPLMITFMTYISPAGLGLYFFVGGIFACIQTLIINYMRPRIRKEVLAELKKNPVKQPKKVVTEAKETTIESSPTSATSKKKRNAGKQNRHK
ncbi:membrane protein insertase YidC [Ligilactobacillus murinus]|jgi:membrane protein insertase, YidC/Oxa1 family, C-terminal domain|uniref:Membrane protein insertase YidC n=2 Tax=Ligilactobacillus murinus TaxID=1622 RepID=A0A2Z4VZ39_9LACO|nr:membrane protein insertase YidC [Ligilactobacillus murinus]NBH86469.1 membrane protein insertase YidC [Lachnospiraceae bacterium]HAB49604.1 membrane protein insertase YidC [Lactobacillus sp.]AWZ38270.1 OxaA precursor [Ligilactobacillus murinus]AWZ40742.1 OxaA precursor [Ligilactobacillus murinus]KRM73578.1 60 kDa inner membrane protein [Ligilactobacillus murinus DSM 20452 = NBRC 14221]